MNVTVEHVIIAVLALALLYTIIQHRNLLEADDPGCPAERTLLELDDFYSRTTIDSTQGYEDGQTVNEVMYSSNDTTCENVYINSATYTYDQAKAACETLCQEHPFKSNKMCTIKDYKSDEYGKIPEIVESPGAYLHPDDQATDPRRNTLVQPGTNNPAKTNNVYAWRCTEGISCDDACETIKSDISVFAELDNAITDDITDGIKNFLDL